MYDKATWYPLVEGDEKYYATSNLGGTLEINNIKIDENNITFNYSKNGIVENGTNYVLIRKKTGKRNYVYPLKQDKTNVGEIVFSRNQDGYTGLGIVDGMLDDLDDLEFTLMFGKVTEYYGKAFETTIPELSIQELKIDNISKTDINMANIEFYYKSVDCVYKIDYDYDGNILKFTGDIDLISYQDENKKVHRVRVKDYEKVSDLIEAIEEHLKYKDLEYSIEYEESN